MQRIQAQTPRVLAHARSRVGHVNVVRAVRACDQAGVQRQAGAEEEAAPGGGEDEHRAIGILAQQPRQVRRHVAVGVADVVCDAGR